jgi:hypothetical protein
MDTNLWMDTFMVTILCIRNREFISAGTGMKSVVRFNTQMVAL